VTSWQDKASALAASMLYPQSRWYGAVCATPRHVLVPRWFNQARDYEQWELRDGPSDKQAWLDVAYDGRQTLVTQIETTHADKAAPGTTCDGWATSSATLPGLVIDMYRHARIFDGADVLDVGTGSGYSAALLTRRLGAEHVTSIDVDPYLTTAANERLSSFGAHPCVLTVDATGDLPGDYDRIVPMVSMPAIPASWLAALRSGGRFVFSLTGGSILITADKTPDGGAQGRVEYDRASFMAARHGPGYAPQAGIPEYACHGDGEHIATSPWPVVDPTWGWELDAVLSVTTPGLTCRSYTDPDIGITTIWLAHDLAGPRRRLLGQSHRRRRRACPRSPVWPPPPMGRTRRPAPLLAHPWCLACARSQSSRRPRWHLPPLPGTVARHHPRSPRTMPGNAMTWISFDHRRAVR
jgi:protein-L-isoaspartate O-methyltransferase